MAYRVEFTSAARRQFKRLSPEVRKRLAPVIDHLADKPRAPGVAKMSGTEYCYRLRVGDYRILYEVCHLVLVIRVGHRREVYRGRR